MARKGLLHRQHVELRPVNVVIATLKGHGFSTPCPLDNFPAFLETALALLAALPEGAILVVKTSSPDTQSQSPLAEQVDQCIILGDQQWVAQRQVGNSSIQANALGPLSSRS